MIRYIDPSNPIYTTPHNPPNQLASTTHANKTRHAKESRNFIESLDAAMMPALLQLNVGIMSLLCKLVRKQKCAIESKEKA
jgi:hypothetical protein